MLNLLCKYNTNVDGANMKPRPWRIAMRLQQGKRAALAVLQHRLVAFAIANAACLWEGWLRLRKQTQTARRGVQGTPCHTTLLARSSVLYLPAERPAKCHPAPLERVAVRGAGKASVSVTAGRQPPTWALFVSVGQVCGAHLRSAVTDD